MVNIVKQTTYSYPRLWKTRQLIKHVQSNNEYKKSKKKLEQYGNEDYDFVVVCLNVRIRFWPGVPLGNEPFLTIRNSLHDK